MRYMEFVSLISMCSLGEGYMKFEAEARRGEIEIEIEIGMEAGKNKVKQNKTKQILR